MGLGSYGGSQQTVFLYSLILAAALCQVSSVSSCNVKVCSQQYTRAVEMDSVQRGPTYRYCTILRSYEDCIRATSRSCRGELEYHTISSLVKQWISSYNCSHVILQGPKQDYNGYTGHRSHKTRPSSAMAECMSYKSTNGSPTMFSHCGLFGDPHLRTFYNELQTCRVKGAWPLIDNPHLAVQVTNDAIFDGSSATATSKVTVIVRKNGPCAQEKTYEAQTDFLPGVFVDGSKSGGPGVRVREISQGRHVEIQLRYIGTRVVIRQVGRYLTFAVKMPRQIAVQGAQQADTLELCVRGCPKRERINFNELLSQPDEFLSVVTAGGQHAAITKKEALATCRRYNVTDFYFDACVFDLLTTGDSNFSVAASEAMHDVMNMHSSSATKHNHNRTSLIPPSSGGAGASQPPGNRVQMDASVTQENSAPGRPRASTFLITIFLIVWSIVRHRLSIDLN